MKHLVSESAVRQCVHRAVQYLAEHQMHNGEFVTYWIWEHPERGFIAPDSNTFTTVLIAHSLLPLRSVPEVEEILRKTDVFLQYQMLQGGIWQFYTRWHRWFDVHIPDADDTALVSAYLKERGIPFPDNRDALIRNRDREGLFYTWFLLRPSLWLHRPTLRTLLTPFRNPLRYLWFRRFADIIRSNSVDIVVNANVVSYLGVIPETQPAIKRMTDLLRQGAELNSDLWYGDPHVVYYFLSRLFPIVGGQLEQVRSTLITRILQHIADRDATMGSLALSMSLSSLLRLRYQGDEIAMLVERIITKQQKIGCWELGTIFHARDIRWGGEAASTAYAAEALHLYLQYSQNL